MMGVPPATGAPAAIGLADSRRSVPPNGATRMPAPLVFTQWSETSPASAAMIAQSPMRPRWPLLRSATAARACRRAFLMPAAIACSPITWPNPNCPSITATVSVSKTIRADWLARTMSFRSQSI